MEITRKDALALFAGLGFKTAESWSHKKLAIKLSRLPSLLEEDAKLEDKDLNKLFRKVKIAIEEKEEITVSKTDKEEEEDRKDKKEAAKAAARKDKEDEDKKEKSSKKEKAEKKPKKEKGPKGPGVIGSIYTILEEGPASIEQILKKLKKIFPDREEKSMLSTVRVQIPGRMSKEKGVTITKDEKGVYTMKKGKK